MAPKAGGRTSARSGSSRDQASSPSKQSRDRASPSPVRRTRSTRSQSAEPLDQNTGGKKSKRGAREGSADSVDSVGSSRGGRTRQATRAAAVARDLSIVLEDRESEHSVDEEELDIEAVGEQSQRLHSPGAISQMSGTTAVTSHSETQAAKIDPLVAQFLPELFTRSRRILELLAPPEITGGTIEKITRELMAPGSNLARLLKRSEIDFNSTRDEFGDDYYINKRIIFRKLFGSDEPGEENFRPDAIIYAANLTILVKQFLITQKNSLMTFKNLYLLDIWFPGAFVYKFDEATHFGRSKLLGESFDIGLEIRTQFAIAVLEDAARKGDYAFDPDRILASTFSKQPRHGDPSPDPSEDITTNGRLEDILRGGPTNSGEQVMQIQNRMTEISEAFRQNVEAVEAGDLVDFDLLEQYYPWSEFLTKLIRWARLRYIELSEGIAKQGGVEQITSDLMEVMEVFESQAEEQYEQIAEVHKPRQLQPSAQIIPGKSKQSLSNSSEAILQLQKMKMTTNASSSAPRKDASAQASSLPQQRTAPAGPTRERTVQDPRNNQSSARQPSDDFTPDFNEEEVMATAVLERPADEYSASWQANTNDKNKENLAMAKPAKRRLDSQRNVESLDRRSLYSASPQAPSRRSRRPVKEEESADEGFEEDRRALDPSRRRRVSEERYSSPFEEDPRPAKRARTQDRAAIEQAEGSAAASRRQERAEAAQRANARRAAIDEDTDDDGPAPTFTQVSIAARADTMRRKILKKEPSKKRTPWSEADTQLLINSIENLGCSWAQIHRQDGWETERDQVALKDKARNIKVSYLKAGIELPHNFDMVHLGKKEINSIKASIPDYEE